MITIEHYRTGTTDDKWVIPELVDQDMYRMRLLSGLLARYEGDCIDCGAHIGVFTALLAEHTDRTIHAFEPTTANSAYLEQNTAKYGDRVRRYKNAVALTPCTLRMTEQEGNEGNFSSSPDGVGEEVEAASLPDFIDGLGSVGLLKLDLEGAEAAILNSISEETLRRVGILVVEEHDQPIRHGRLRRMGFRIAFRPFRARRHMVYVRKEIPWWSRLLGATSPRPGG